MISAFEASQTGDLAIFRLIWSRAQKTPVRFLGGTTVVTASLLLQLSREIIYKLYNLDSFHSRPQN